MTRIQLGVCELCSEESSEGNPVQVFAETPLRHYQMKSVDLLQLHVECRVQIKAFMRLVKSEKPTYIKHIYQIWAKSGTTGGMTGVNS